MNNNVLRSFARQFAQGIIYQYVINSLGTEDARAHSINNYQEIPCFQVLSQMKSCCSRVFKIIHIGSSMINRTVTFWHQKRAFPFLVINITSNLHQEWHFVIIFNQVFQRKIRVIRMRMSLGGQSSGRQTGGFPFNNFCCDWHTVIKLGM